MFSSRLAPAVAAAALITMAAAQGTPTDSSASSILAIPTPTASFALKTMTDIGCFNDSRPLQDHGPWTFQTSGNCQPICVGLGKPVMGLVDGSNCWCGDLKPPKDSMVANSSCDTPCNGFPEENCGGPSLWWISLTGITNNRIEFFDPQSSAAPSKTPTPQSSEPASTVLVTATEEPTQSSQPSKGGPNKAGIAAGVVVGVVVLVAIIAGVFLYLRQKKRREVEEEYRRQAAVNQFVSGGKLHTSNSSMTDSRLDPEFMARRASNGSIADNEDYSRRILRVTN